MSNYVITTIISNFFNNVLFDSNSKIYRAVNLSVTKE